MRGKGERKKRDGGSLDWTKKATGHMRVFAVVGLAVVVFSALIFGVLRSVRFAPTEVKASVEMYKNPECNCCEWYATYLRNHGYSVVVKPTHNLSLVRREHGVPRHLAGCHTLLVDGYVVEGHVPVSTLNKLLTERPKIKGISLPGMPEGSPGMTGTKTGPFTIYEISDDEQKVYALE